MEPGVKNSYRELFSVTFLYILATLVMTYPIAFRPGEHYSAHTDYLQGLWNFWWFKEALFELGQNPYFSDHVFYPTGVSLAFHTLSVANAAMALPFLFAFGVVTSYNIVYLITFVLAGVGTYLLVHDLTGNRHAAFLSGLVLAFCPYHFIKSYQIWAASLEWMPLFAFFFLRFMRGGGLKEAALSALMLFLASLSSWYLMAFTFIFIAISIVYYLFTNPARVLTVHFVRHLSFMAGLFGLLVLPFAYPMVKEVIWGESYMYTSLYAQFLKGSRGLVEGRTGSTFQVGMTQLFGMRLAAGIFWPGILGYTAIFLAAYGIVRGELKEKGLWVASAIMFFLFLLGPYLTVFDRVYERIPLPYFFLNKLPIFKAVRYPHRFMAPLMMCLSVLAGSGALALARSISSRGVFSGKRTVPIVLAVLSAAVMVEFLAAPVGNFRISVPSFYKMLAEDRQGEYAIVEVPIMTPFTTEYMYYQTFHGKKIPGGQIVHPREEIIDFLKTTPVIRDLANPVLKEERGESQELPANAAAILSDLDIRYVVLHTDILRPYRATDMPGRGKKGWSRTSLMPAFLNPQRDRLQETFYSAMRNKTAFDREGSLEELQQALRERFGPPVYEDEYLTVYEARGAADGKPRPGAD